VSLVYLLRYGQLLFQVHNKGRRKIKSRFMLLKYVLFSIFLHISESFECIFQISLVYTGNFGKHL
jgi:hypothetical protein